MERNLVLVICCYYYFRSLKKEKRDYDLLYGNTRLVHFTILAPIHYKSTTFGKDNMQP